MHLSFCCINFNFLENQTHSKNGIYDVPFISLNGKTNDDILVQNHIKAL